MRTRIRRAISLLFAPALLAGQGAAPPAGMQAAFDRMAANVAKITVPGEGERWRANVELWRVRIANLEPLCTADLRKMGAELATIDANVARISPSPERERWRANADLWRMVLICREKPRKSDAGEMKSLLARLVANVTRVNGPDEKERWDANRDLWQAYIARLPEARAVGR